MSSADLIFKSLLMLILHAAHQELGGRHQDGILDFCKHVLYSLPLAKPLSQPNAVSWMGTCPALNVISQMLSMGKWLSVGLITL